MKYTLALVLVFLTCNMTVAEKSEVVITAADYSCSQLKEIVKMYRVVYFEGLGSRNVYARAEDACSGDGLNENNAYWFQTYWDSKDGLPCRVGYGCRAYRDSTNDDAVIDDGDDIDFPDVGKGN